MENKFRFCGVLSHKIRLATLVVCGKSHYTCGNVFESLCICLDGRIGQMHNLIAIADWYLIMGWLLKQNIRTNTNNWDHSHISKHGLFLSVCQIYWRFAYVHINCHNLRKLSLTRTKIFECWRPESAGLSVSITTDSVPSDLWGKVIGSDYQI